MPASGSKSPEDIAALRDALRPHVDAIDESERLRGEDLAVRVEL